MYKVYAKTNNKGVVEELYSDIDRQPEQGDICVETINGEYSFERHCDTVIADMDGHYNYKVANGKLEIRTTQEKETDIKPKTELDTIQETLDMVVLSMLGGDLNV